MSKLRFAILCVHTCPLGKLGGKDAGGMNVYVRELAIALGKKGHRVDVFTHAHDDAHPGVMELAENARLVHVKAGEPREITKLSLYAYLPEMTANIEAFRRSEGISNHVIFSHYWLSGYAGQVLTARWRIPHLVMFHTLGLVKNTLVTGEDEPELRTETEKLLVRGCDRIIASTPEEKNILVKLYGSDRQKIAVAPCGVNLDLFRPLDRVTARRALGMENEKVLLFAGRIEALKGIDRLVESVALLKDITNLKLIILGGDEQSRREIDRLKMKARKLGVIRRIEFREPVPQVQLPAYYSAADIFVLPSYYESFGMAALEALACGTPVVAADVGSMRTIIKDGVNGFISSDNSPPNLSGKLRAALETKFADCETVRGSVLNYGWDRIAAKIVNECNKAIMTHQKNPPRK